MKKVLIVLIVLVVVALMLGSSFINSRNQMAVKREAVNAAWAQVDVVLQRRADLIPNLVETVKGFAAQEQTVFGDIAKARFRFAWRAFSGRENRGEWTIGFCAGALCS